MDAKEVDSLEPEEEQEAAEESIASEEDVSPVVDDIPSISFWRISEPQDAVEIKSMIRIPQTTNMFGRVDVGKLIENSFLAISQLNAVGQLVAHISLLNYPNIPVVPTGYWVPWIKDLYRLKNATERNSLFIHLVVWNHKYAYQFLRLLLDSVFLQCQFIQFILMVIPPGAAPSDIFDDYFEKIYPQGDFDDLSKVQCLYICVRHHHVPKQRIRKAVEEDHDDLMPLLNKTTDRLRKTYGEYFLAELIADHESYREVIVSEYKNHAVGMLSLNTQIDLEVLNGQFELTPFYGLRKPTPEDRIPLFTCDQEDSKENLRITLSSSPLLNVEFLLSEHFESIAPHLRESYKARSLLIDMAQEGNEDEEFGLTDDHNVEAAVTHRPAIFTTTLLNRETFHDISIGQTDHHSDDSQESEDDGNSISLQSMDFISPSNLEAVQKGDISKDENTPMHFGESNAFAVELFIMHENFDERMTYDFLEAAFECFPELDYCIATLPSSYPVFPLLEHFVRAVPHAGRKFAHELYVVHRNAVLGELCVREAQELDDIPLQYLLRNVQDHDKILIDFMLAVNSKSNCFAYVMTSEESVVGVAIIQQLNDVSCLVSNYNIDKYISLELLQNETAVIQHMVLSPIFHKHSRYFFKQIMKLSGNVALVYPLYGAEHGGTDVSKIASIKIPKANTLEKYTENLMLNLQENAHLIYSILTNKEVNQEVPGESFYERVHITLVNKDVQEAIVITADVELTASEEQLLYSGQKKMNFHNVKLDFYWQNLNHSTLISTLTEMVPVLPRSQIQYDRMKLGGNTPDRTITNFEDPFALYFINNRFSTIPKRDMNMKIVIVGSGKIALSFVETLLFGPWCAYIQFTNINLISLHGLPTSKYPHKARDILLGYRYRFTTDYINRLCLRTWLNITYGMLTGIDRVKKQVIVDDSSTIPYDFLFLFCGEQYIKPTKKARKRLQYEEKCHHNRKKSVNELPGFPLNVFFINTDIDACNALTSLQHAIGYQKIYNIIVYGHNFQAFSCIAALQQMGIPGRNITFVEPLPNKPHSVSVFNDDEVDEAVMNSMYDCGVTVYSRYYFTEWEYGTTENQKIVAASFESKIKSIKIDCLAMFFFGEKGVSHRTFQALIQASLVYDGHLVINNQYQTNDPCIYAAGSLTKYARRYYAERYNHRYYCSVEIGEKLAVHMMNLWMNVSAFDIEETDKTLVPLFWKPLVYSLKLPGLINYLYVTKPGEVVPLEAQMAQDTFGYVLVTGSTSQPDPGYFRIRFNPNNFVEDIVCYTKDDIDVENLQMLYGLHEKILNNILTRFELGTIRNFFEFFREPWACALFHDRFNEMRIEAFESFTAMQVSHGKTLDSWIRATFESQKWKKMSDEILFTLEENYRFYNIEKKIENKFLEYLQKNNYHLPMYIYPEALKHFLQEHKYSPLHKNVNKLQYSRTSIEVP